MKMGGGKGSFASKLRSSSGGMGIKEADDEEEAEEEGGSPKKVDGASEPVGGIDSLIAMSAAVPAAQRTRARRLSNVGMGAGGRRGSGSGLSIEELQRQAQEALELAKIGRAHV